MKVRLGDVFSVIRNGASIKQKDGAIGYPITRIETISERYVNRNKLGYADIINIAKYNKFILEDEDILMSHINSEKHLAKVALYKRKQGETIIHGMNLLMLRADRQYIAPSYAVLLFESNRFLNTIKTISKKSVNQASFTVTALKDIVIQLPDLKIQEKIANQINAVSHSISLQKKCVLLLEQLVKSRFMEMFGDPWNDSNKYPLERLSNLSEKITDGVHKKPTYTQSGRPFLSVVNINKRVVDFSNCKFISNNDFDLIAKSNIANKGDILYTKVGTYGIAAHVETDIKFALYVSVCLIKPKHNIINSCFLAHSMNMPYVKYQADRRVKGIGVPDLHLNQIREFSIIVPPLPLQQQFAAFVEKVDKSKLAVKQSLEKLETLKKSLMQQYFG